MKQDFFYALILGWSILLFFWLMVITFIFIRKPPKSKLTNKVLLYSFSCFALGYFIISILT